MKQLILCGGVAILLLFTANALIACSDDDTTEETTEAPTPPSDEGNDNEKNDDSNESMKRNITISINGTSFTATLEDNEAGRTFASMLPLTLDMSEMNGNEKYHYLDKSLPTDGYRPGTIRTGDLMLYGSSCVVLFYETFSSDYIYTRLGRVDNPEGLAAALGDGDISLKFAITENP